MLDNYPGARVIVMPAAAPPLRGDERLFSFRERFRLLRRLFAAEIAAGRVILSNIEASLPGPNYTVHTLAALARLCPARPIIVVGQDQAANLTRWHQADYLLQNFEFVVFARAGALAGLPAFRKHTLMPDFDEKISATEVREMLKRLEANDRLRAAENLNRQNT